MKHTTSAKRPVAVLLTLLLIVALTAPAAAFGNSFQYHMNLVTPDGLGVMVWSANDLPWATGTNLITTSPDRKARTYLKSNFEPPAGWKATPLFDSVLFKAPMPDGGGLPNAVAMTYEYTLELSDLGLNEVKDFQALTSDSAKAKCLTDRGFAVLFEYEADGTFPLIGVGAPISWQTALDRGIARLDINNDWVIRLDINLAIFDADGTKFGLWGADYMFVNDGIENNEIFDPVWLVTGMTQIAGGGDWVTVAGDTDSKSNPHTGR